MVYDLMDTGCAENGEPSNVAVGIPAERFSPAFFLSNSLCCEISLPVLAAQCLRELGNYRRGEPCTDTYGLELLRRATIQDNQEAWAWVQHCFGGMVRGWLRRHPKREVACRLESEENYVAQTFERFWQATAFNQRVEFSTLAAALQYLRASLHGTILDMLRAHARPGEVLLLEPAEPGVPLVEDNTDNGEVWESLHMLLSNPREKRVAFLLFHCGLGPREIIRFCPQEWSDIQEIYCLRRAIMERVLRNADRLRWRLS
jgi:DNA-directed RNA polymerase specialized sigma24 family protein